MAAWQPGAWPDAMTTPSQRHQLFISYSHADRQWVDRLQTMMKPLVRNYDLKLWDDSQIPAGAKWKEEIELALSTAKVALLLVSSDFLASDFVNHSELPHILKAAEEKGVQILWVPLRSSLVHLTPINDYQAVVNPKRPLQAMDVWEQDEAMLKIAEAINTTFKEAREKEEQERQQAENVAREEEERQRKNTEHQQNLQRYERDFSRAIDAQYPLDNLAVDRFKKLQQELGLNIEDIAQIEEPLLAPKQEEHQRKQSEERKRQQAEAERVAQEEAKRAQAEAERQAREEKERQRREAERVAQEAEENERKAEEERKRKAEAERRARERQEEERLAREKEFRGFSRQLLSGCEVGLIVPAGTGFLGGQKWHVEKRPLQVQGYGEELAPGVSITLVEIPAGTFLMGSPPGEEGRDWYASLPDNLKQGLAVEGVDVEAQRRVSVRTFLMGRFPITQAQWRMVAGWEKVERELDSDPSRFKGAERPVEKVSWHDAIEFCRRLSNHTWQNYALPSEAQWEYACRAGTTTPFHFGETLTTELANYDGNYAYGKGLKGSYREQTSDVGSFPANAWGLQDMHGNVWEWCLERWHPSLAKGPSDGSAWQEPAEVVPNEYRDWRLLRGGSWIDNPRSCRSAARDGYHPGGLGNDVGFRVCCLPP